MIPGPAKRQPKKPTTKAQGHKGIFFSLWSYLQYLIPFHEFSDPAPYPR